MVDAQGRDLSAAFVAGARQTLQLAQAQGIRVAVLKEGSPSCGSAHLHDGTFSGIRIRGQGVTAALLAEAGLQVFSEAQFDQAQAFLEALATGRTA